MSAGRTTALAQWFKQRWVTIAEMIGRVYSQSCYEAGQDALGDVVAQASFNWEHFIADASIPDTDFVSQPAIAFPAGVRVVDAILTTFPTLSDIHKNRISQTLASMLNGMTMKVETVVPAAEARLEAAIIKQDIEANNVYITTHVPAQPPVDFFNTVTPPMPANKFPDGNP